MSTGQKLAIVLAGWIAVPSLFFVGIPAVVSRLRRALDRRRLERLYQAPVVIPSHERQS